MKNINLIIIEDDIPTIRAVSRIIESQFSEIRIIETASQVQESILKIEALKPDILLMDIHLIDGTAFDILRQCSYNDFKIVFMSGYDDTSIKAMQHSDIEFIFKPFDISELIVAIDKAIEQLTDNNYALRINTLFENIDKTDSTVVLQGKHSIKACEIGDIVWGKAIYGGANFYFIDGSYFFVSKPLRRYEAILSDYSFFRCHPHYLINLSHVKEINTNLFRIKMNTGDEIAYENRRYTQLNKQLQHSKPYSKNILNKAYI